MTPVEIKKIENSALKITWSNGTTALLDNKKLRTNCPCAECREDRGDSSHSKPLTTRKKNSLKIVQNSIDEQISLEKIWSIGNYSLGILWRDYHDSGIYTFEFLKELSDK